jgi:hypothetical protein
MSNEPSVPPYAVKSPPAYGATYGKEPDKRPLGERVNGGNGHRPAATPPVASGSLTELLGQFWTRYRPLKSVDGSDDSPASSNGDDDGVAGVVYAITKKTDFWFDREVSTIERDARKEAADWAAQGLPRHDLARVDPLEIELVLAGRCIELFRQWVARVHVKARDAINTEADLVASETSNLEATIDRLGALRDTSRRNDEEMADLQKKEHEEHPPLGFEPLVSRPRLFFSLLAVLLVAVEFFANFPLFRLLLPLHSSLAAAAKEAVLDVGDQWWAGIALWWKMSAWHVEAFVVSLAVVIVMVVFGKTVGASARLLTAMRASDHPLAAGSINSARRQAWAVVLACALGAGLVITALYRARTEIVVAAQDRVETTARNLDSLRAQSRLPGQSLSQVSSVAQSIRDQERTLEVHRDDYGYAQTVQRNNVAILLLNIGLVLAAGVVGFLAAGYKLVHQFGADPRIADLRARQVRNDAELREQLANGYQSMTRANAGIGRVQHLLRSSPLEQWPAKARRLSAIIPLFRADNARLRNLDSASILAFRAPPPLELPTFEAETGFDEPADFAALKDRYSHARLQFTRLAGAAP